MTTATCKHHFLLPESNGPTSLGVCKNCGEEKECRNSYTDQEIWRGSKRPGQLSKRSNQQRGSDTAEYYAGLNAAMEQSE